MDTIQESQNATTRRWKLAVEGLAFGLRMLAPFWQFYFEQSTLFSDLVQSGSNTDFSSNTLRRGTALKLQPQDGSNTVRLTARLTFSSTTS